VLILTLAVCSSGAVSQISKRTVEQNSTVVPRTPQFPMLSSQNMLN